MPATGGSAELTKETVYDIIKIQQRRAVFGKGENNREQSGCGGSTGKMLTEDVEYITLKEAIEKVGNVTEFIIADSKIEGFCLRPDSKHWKEFESVGFTVHDGDILRSQIRSVVENGERVEIAIKGENIKFAVYGELGITKKSRFCTAWQIDAGTTSARYISGYKKGR